MNKLFNLIGLATRAGRTKGGSFLTEQAVKTGAACLVVLAEDASRRTKHDIQAMCAYYEVDCICCGSKEQLGKFTGHEYRSAVAVTDTGFAEAIKKRYQQLEQKIGGSCDKPLI